MKAFLKAIDFKKLKKQKQDLLETITLLEKQKINDKADRLTGIVSLIDSIQDKAVDEYGYDENEVFDLK